MWGQEHHRDDETGWLEEHPLPGEYRAPHGAGIILCAVIALGVWVAFGFWLAWKTGAF